MVNGSSLLYAPARSTTQEEREPMAMAAIMAITTKKGMVHCFFTKPRYPLAPVPWNPEVSTAQPQYTAHSRNTKK